MVGPGIYMRITPTSRGAGTWPGEPVGDTWYEARRAVHGGG